MSPLTTSSLPGRIRFTHSTSLPPRCVCGGLLDGVMTSPPQAAIPAIGFGLPLALSAMMWMVLSYITSPLAPPTSMLVQLGLIPAASHRPTYQRLHGTVGCSTPSTSRTRRRQSGPTFALSGSSANGSNHSLGDASLLRSRILGIVAPGCLLNL